MENHVFFSNQVWQGCRVLLELRGYHHQLKQQTLWCFREIYWQPPFFWKIYPKLIQVSWNVVGPPGRFF